MLKRIYIKIGYEILAKKSDKCTHPHRLGSVYKAGTRTCFFEEHILCRRDNSNSVIKSNLSAISTLEQLINVDYI